MYTRYGKNIYPDHLNGILEFTDRIASQNEANINLHDSPRLSLFIGASRMVFLSKMLGQRDRTLHVHRGVSVCAENDEYEGERDARSREISMNLHILPRWLGVYFCIEKTCSSSVCISRLCNVYFFFAFATIASVPGLLVTLHSLRVHLHAPGNARQNHFFLYDYRLRKDKLDFFFIIQNTCASNKLT